MIFLSAKFRMTFLAIDLKFLNFPSDISTEFLHLRSPVSKKLHFPLFFFISPYFRSICVFASFTYFSSPYIDRDAFVHHTMHVLGVPVKEQPINLQFLYPDSLRILQDDFFTIAKQ